MVDSFRLTVSLWVIGSREGDVVFKEAGEFSCEGKGKLGSSVGDDLAVETKSWEDVLEKDLGNVCCRCSFVARAENYPLRKTMVYHDQNRIIAVGGREVSNEIHGDLLERVGAFRRDGGEQGKGRVGVNLIGLASSTAGDEFLDKGGHSQPPIVLLEKGDGVEISAVGSGK